MSSKYLGKEKKEYNKSKIINNSNKKMKLLLKSNASNNSKRVGLKNVFINPEFKNFVKDVKKRVQKLNREYAIQQANYSENEIPKEISNLANALNDYTENLVGFYEKKYFNIPNENNRKQFIRDLKLIIGTYGELEENLHNIIYNNNKNNKNNNNNNNNNNSLIYSNSNNNTIFSKLNTNNSLYISNNESNNK